MIREESVWERSLYFLIAMIINLTLFTLLSAYLLLARSNYQVSKPIKLLFEEPPKEEVVVFNKKGEGEFEKGKRVGSASSVPPSVAKETEVSPTPSVPPLINKDLDVPINPKEATQESVLSEIEEKVKSKKAENLQSRPTLREDLGELSGVISEEGVGFSKGYTRKILYIPPFPKFRTTEPPSTFQAKLWVEPSGMVSNVEVLKRSGVPEIDSALVQVLRSIRFEPIEGNIMQTGIITFRFKGG